MRLNVDCVQISRNIERYCENCMIVKLLQPGRLPWNMLIKITISLRYRQAIYSHRRNPIRKSKRDFTKQNSEQTREKTIGKIRQFGEEMDQKHGGKGRPVMLRIWKLETISLPNRLNFSVSI